MKQQIENRAPHTIYMRDWRARNPHHAIYQKAYWETYYPANAATIKANAAAWVANNPERARATAHAYYMRHKAECMARAKEWREANPEKAREQDRKKSAKWRDKKRLERLHCT